MIRILIVAAVIGGALGYWYLSKRWLRWIMRRRRQRGRQGELDAAWLLLDAGYEILQDQESREVTVQVDGEPRHYGLRPDYLVQKQGRQYVAEVKTGKKAPNPLYTPTRRQLLEYAVCYPDHGLLLVDMESKEVHEVGWPELQAAVHPSGLGRRLLGLLLLAFGLGVFVGLLVMMI